MGNTNNREALRKLVRGCLPSRNVNKNQDAHKDPALHQESMRKLIQKLAERVEKKDG